MKIKNLITGHASDVRSFVERLKSACSDCIVFCSIEHPLACCDKVCEEVAVFVTVQEDA